MEPKRIRSVPGIFGGTDHYDEDGNYLGYSMSPTNITGENAVTPLRNLLLWGKELPLLYLGKPRAVPDKQVGTCCDRDRLDGILTENRIDEE